MLKYLALYLLLLVSLVVWPLLFITIPMAYVMIRNTCRRYRDLKAARERAIAHQEAMLVGRLLR